MTDTASVIIGKHRHKKKPWVTIELLDMCDRRRVLKRGKNSPEGTNKYREINKEIRTGMKEAKEKWIEEQCIEIEDNLNKNSSKRAFQVIKDLTSEKKGRINTIQDKSGKCLTEKRKIINRWTEYCTELYNSQTKGHAAVLDRPMNTEVLDRPMTTEEDNFSILREEVEAAVKSLKKGKSARVDNIPVELIQAGGKAVTNILTAIYNKIWQTGDWPTPWTQSMVITLPKKATYSVQTTGQSASSAAQVVMLKVILNRLKPQAEDIIAEEQAGFRAEHGTTNQIFNLRILCEKYLQHQEDLYHVFFDFKKAFDRVWHAALWATMRKYNIAVNLV